MQNLRIWLEEKAKIAGFDKLAVTKAILPDEVGDRLSHFIAEDRQGDMAWLAESQYRRAQPQHMWPEARTALVLACNYGPDHNPMDNLAAAEAGNISVYARSKDYHDILKGQLKQLAGQLVAKTGWQVKVFVDTAPLMEKPLAMQAGLGWQGKHTNLVAKDFGSWFFLGTILTDGEMPEDTPMSDHCGRCQACLDICPTKAFPAPYQLDARRCISYLTIEHKGPIDRALRPLMGNRIFGCDDCLAVCPWNKFAEAASHPKLQAKQGTNLPDIISLLALDEPAFRAQFAGTPVRRAGHIRFLRNVLIAAGNSGASALIAPVTPFLRHDAPLVRAMAIWALSQLAPLASWQDGFDAVAEQDEDVLAEWQAAQSGGDL